MSATTAEDCELDPQIQIELENLNSATDEINKLEIELEEANSTFRILLNESTRRLKLSSKRLGNCIEKARPYYEAIEKARSAQIECQQAAMKFQRANEIHTAAKETVALAEQRFLSNSHEWQFDNAWQEMLNHATQKVMDAEKKKAECHAEHLQRTEYFKATEHKIQQLEDRFKRSINKSRPYFEEKQLCQDQLQTQKNRIQELQQQVQAAKNTYSTALRNLERISNDIHRQRGDYPALSGTPPPPAGPREPGVGAELNTPTTTTLPDFEAELEKCDYPSIAGSQMSLGAYSLPAGGSGSGSVGIAPTAELESELEEDAGDYADSDELRGVIDEQDLEALRQKMKILAVRPIEGGDGQQQQHDAGWEHELKATVDKLDHLMMLREAQKYQAKQQRPNSLGAEAFKRHTDAYAPNTKKLSSTAIAHDDDNDDVVVVVGNKGPLIKINKANIIAAAATATNNATSLPATPEHLRHLHNAKQQQQQQQQQENPAQMLTPIKTLQKLEPLPSANVSMRELPLLARLSNELLDRSTAVLGGLNIRASARKERRRSLE